MGPDRYATCALIIADHAAGFPDYHAHDSIEWGTWRCNIAALSILSFDRCGKLPAHHFVTKMCGSFCGALSAFGSTADESVRFMRNGRFDECALNLGLNIAAVLVFLEIVAVNRGEVDRLWIFLAAFQSILVGHACTWRESNATFHMVIVISLLQSALTNSLVMFAAPGEYSHRCWGGTGLRCNEDLKQPSGFG